MKLTVEMFIELSEVHNKAVTDASFLLSEICKNHYTAMGLIDDETKKSEAYIKAERQYNIAFAKLRQFNASIPNQIKREAAKIRRMKK